MRKYESSRVTAQQGDSRPLPEREVSSQHPLLFKAAAGGYQGVPGETLMFGDTTQDESSLSEETLMLGDTTQDESLLSEELQTFEKVRDDSYMRKA